MCVNEHFREIVKLALYGADTQTIQAGGVHFWFDEHDNLCFSEPTNKWDMPTLVKELSQLTSKGLERARKAVSDV